MDASNAAVPGAAVVIKDVDRNTERRTETDTVGRYVLTALPPGTYTLSVEAAGFQKYQRSAFRLDVQQQATVDVQMQVGEVTTSVMVESAAPLLNTTSANLGQVIENRYIDSLPLVNRNVFALTYMTAGVVAPGGQYGDTRGTNFSAVGGRNSTSEVMLDGQTFSSPEHNGGINTVPHQPSVESIEEFKIQTSFFSAEFGQTGTAIINMITKSGTNQFHGSGYWYYRHSSLNANGFFSNRAGSARPNYERHLYGGTLGGPIRKDKTFAFVNYERTPQGNPVNTTATFPTMQQREGNFSDYLLNNQQINIFNPFDTFTNAAGAVRRRPFANNVIPKTMMDPVALAAASYYPEPNQPGITNNWYNTGIQDTVQTQIEVKVDHNFTDKDRLSGRYTWRGLEATMPEVFGKGRPGLPWEYGVVKVGANPNAGFDYTRAHSARTVINLRYGLSRTYFDGKQHMQFDLRTLGFPQYMYDTALDFNKFGDIFPRFVPAGYTEIGNAGWQHIDRNPRTHQFIGSVTRISGGHNLKIGGEYRRMYLMYLQPNNPAGAFNFDRLATSQDPFTANTLEGNGFASMLAGWGSGGGFDHTPTSYSNSAYLAGYIQDEWKVTRKLTLNLGLRYELPRPRWEKEYRETYWNLNDPSPLAGKVPNMDLRGFLAFCSKDNPSPFNGDHNNWQPRVGFAYAVDDKTSIRAGYALLYAMAKSSLTGRLGLGFTSSSNWEPSRDSGLTRHSTLSDPFPDGLTLPIGRSQGPMSFIGLAAGVPTRDDDAPSYHSWTFSVQRQLAGANLVEVNYAGTKGVHQFVNITNLNLLDPMYWGVGRTVLNRQVPNPFYGVIMDPKSVLSRPLTQQYRLYQPYPQYASASHPNDPTAGDTQYHSLQFKFERRFSRGLAMLAHYTISKAIDNVGGGSATFLAGGPPGLQDVYNLKNERALSPSDVPQRLVLTFSYDLPIGTGRALGNSWGSIANAFLGGWQLGGFLTFQSGVPLQVTQASGQLWNGTQRPNLVGDPSTSGPVVDRINSYFNLAAFSKPPADVPGTAARFLNYRVSGIRTADLSMLKAFRVREGMQGEFRFEVHNAANTPSFGAPNTSYGSTAFGRITGYKNNLGPRAAQIALKFRF